MEEDADRDINWNPQIEVLIKEEGEKAFGYAWLHNKSEIIYSKFESYISLPVIVLSTVTGFLSASSQTLFPNIDSSIILGAISIGVGVLNTIGSKFAFSKRAEGHRIASIHYGKLHRFINIELSLPRNERMNPNEMLKVIRTDIDRLKETAPAIPEHIIKLFNEKFEHETGIAVPEITNGLSRIQIFREEVRTPRQQQVVIPATPTSPVRIGIQI